MDAPTPYPSPWNVKTILGAIEGAFPGYLLLPEVGIVGDGSRLDAVMIPHDAFMAEGLKLRRFEKREEAERLYSKPRAALVGIEVKLTRADFQRGLREGQFDRYAANLGALYLATGRDVCRTAEIPESVGHLIVANRIPKPTDQPRGHEAPDYPVILIRRHARFRVVETDPEILWRAIFAVSEWARRRVRAAEVRKEERTDRAIERLSSAMRETLRRLREPLGE